jgi:hypothetical protein
MNIKRVVVVAAAVALAGSAFATPTTFAGREFRYYDISKVPALTFASQSRQQFYNHDIYVRYDDYRGGSIPSLQSIYSVPDSKWTGPGTGHNNVSPVPEPETYALMLAGLLVVFTIARRRRGRSWTRS